MNYPRTVYDISTMMTQNREALVSEFQIAEETLDQVSKIPAIVEVFTALKEKEEDLEGDILKIFAGCAYMCFKEGFGNLRAEAEAPHYSTHARLMAG